MEEKGGADEPYMATFGESIRQPLVDGQNGLSSMINRSKRTTSFGFWKIKHQEAISHWEESWRVHEDEVEKQ